VLKGFALVRTGGHLNRDLNLLLVEEDCVSSKIIKIVLSNAGIQGNLYIVHNGQECLRFLRRQAEYVSAPTPDVIIIDLNLLRDGTTQLNALKAYTDTAGIPVIILADDFVEQKVLAPYIGGIFRSLNPPSKIDDFMVSIREIIFDLLPDVVGGPVGPIR
jgi:CheY-like chemotaxis protein